MSVRRLALAVLLCFAFVRTLAPLHAAPAATDIPADPLVRHGLLPNGLRYALLPNPEPRGRASLRLTVAAGSLHEGDEQRGLAHFLEHMAFNGSPHFPAGSLVEFFQRLGMAFGGDTNASTGFDRTVYQLELPDTRPETFREALAWFADVAGRLDLAPAEIDRERGIILAEKRARDSVGYRTFLAELDFLIPDTRLPHRLPIGTDEVIRSAPREQFTAFYDTWYRPERMTVTVVGDFDPATVETQLADLLGPLTARAPARPEPHLGSLPAGEALIARLHSEPEAPATTVSIQTIAPYRHEPDTAANRVKYLPRTLALRMLNRRLAILAKAETAPFTGGTVGVTEQFDFFRNASLELTCAPERWRETLAAGEQELRRSLDFGFQPAELVEAVAALRNSLHQTVQTAATRRSPDLADELADDLFENNVFNHPDTDLAIYGPALGRVTVDECLAALRAAWGETAGRFLFVSGNLTLPDAERTILAAYAASRATPVLPPAAIADDRFAYTDFGPPGRVAQRSEVADLGVTQVVFANGVRLNLKPTDFEAGRIRLTIRLGGGLLTMPANQPGLSLVASAAFTSGGLGRHSADDLQRLLAGRTLGLGFSTRPDAFLFTGTTNRADLLLQFQLLTAFITDPGYRPESLRQLRRNLDQLYNQIAHTPEGPLQTEAALLLAGGDVRFGYPPRAELEARSLDELKAWLAPQLARGPIEVAVVGDFDPDATLDAVARTLGALPARDSKPDYTAARRIPAPAAPLARQFTVTSDIPRGLVELHWPAGDGQDVRRSRRVGLLAEVLADRLRRKIREEMGGTYSPNAAADLSDTFTGFGWLTAEATVAPDQARTIADAIRAVAADLHAHGVTDEELIRAKQPILTSLRETMRSNSYWLGTVLAAAQEFPERLAWSRTRYADTEAVTAAELSQLARDLLDPTRAHEFISLPAAATPAAPAAVPGS